MYLDNKMLSLMIYAGYEGGDVTEKYITRISGVCKFFLQ